MDTNSNSIGGGGWNYRVVIEREPDLVNKGEYVESFSFRDVYYDKSGKATSWGSDPQHPVGETLEFLLDDISMMAEALQKPFIIIQDDKIIDERHPSSQEGHLINSLLKSREHKKLTNEFKERAYGMHEYQIEEKRRELELEIEKAKMQGEFEKAKTMMSAYQKFREDVQRQQMEQERMKIKPVFDPKKYEF